MEFLTVVAIPSAREHDYLFLNCKLGRQGFWYCFCKYERQKSDASRPKNNEKLHQISVLINSIVFFYEILYIAGLRGRAECLSQYKS
jgi:hypothetical protein